MDNGMICRIHHKNGKNETHKIKKYCYIRIADLIDSDIDSICVECADPLIYSVDPIYTSFDGHRITRINPSIYSDDTPYVPFDGIFKIDSYPDVMPKKIIFNGPATIVIWDDGTKTVVKQSNLDNYDYEKGFAMCVVKKVFGDKYNAIRKMVDESYENTLTPITDEVNECFFAKLFGKKE